MRTRIRVAGALVALGILAGACGDDSDSSSPDTTGSATTAAGATAASTAAATTAAPADVCTADRKGGRLTMGTGVQSVGLDPATALGTGIAGGTELTAIYDTLMRYDTATGKYIPHVAQSLTPNADFTEWTLKLKPNIKFGNGDPLTTEAVKFSIERMAKATVAASGLAQEVQTMTIVDPLTMTLKLRQAYGAFEYVLAQETGMVVNPKVFSSMAPADFNKLPKGAGVGPFEPTRFAPGEEITMTAKADYWGGPVCIETLRFVNIVGARATYDAFKKNELDVMFLSDAPVIDESRKANVKNYNAVGGAGSSLFINVGRGSARPTNDPRLRQAIHAAIDVNVLNQRVLGGAGKASTALIWKDQVISPGIDGPKYDLNKAKDLVTQVKAGGWNGNLTLTCGNTPTATEQSVTIQAMLQAAGMTVTVENLASTAQNQKVLIEGNFDIACQGIAIFDAGPLSRLNQFGSDSVRNRVGYKNPQMDAALTQLTKANTLEDTKKALGQIQTVWNNDPPAVNLWANEWYIGTTDKVRGVRMTRDQVVMFDQVYLAK
ncbi:MAG: ABC transporter substrate-binding protein [Acidimicrobiia bacterium]